jgi:hypothetical protein
MFFYRARLGFGFEWLADMVRMLLAEYFPNKLIVLIFHHSLCPPMSLLGDNTKGMSCCRTSAIGTLDPCPFARTQRAFEFVSLFV